MKKKRIRSRKYLVLKTFVITSNLIVLLLPLLALAIGLRQPHVFLHSNVHGCHGTRCHPHAVQCGHGGLVAVLHLHDGSVAMEICGAAHEASKSEGVSDVEVEGVVKVKGKGGTNHFAFVAVPGRLMY